MPSSDAVDVLVVGAGQAGGEVAAGLRARNFPGSILLVGDEAHLPYSRPPLSKAYLKGEATIDDLYLRPESFYRDHHVDFKIGTHIDAVDQDSRTARLSDGTTISWGDLVFATGGRPRRLPDAELGAAANVHYLRAIVDVDKLSTVQIPGSSFVILGGGYVGLEVAAVLRQLGAQVTVVEAADRLLGRVTSPVVSEFFRRVHTEEGVDVRLATQVLEYHYVDGNVAAVRLSDDTTVPTDQLLIGIGMIPNDDLARAAGLDVDNGIIVDDLCRTSGAHIYAIGDVARHPDSRTGLLRRLESMPNATAQARVVADHITGTSTPYRDDPWFWSDQYDIKLQAAGLVAGHDDLVVRGDPGTGRKFSVLYLKDGRICAVDAIGRPADYAGAKRLIEQNSVVDPARLRDTTVPLLARSR
jgi:3-phenylpropionate/trans-cinnamate dioxygenase ferredoxin reductase subunit